MNELIDSPTTALSLATRMREIGSNIRDAEFKNLLADLSLQLADAKLEMADLIEQNRALSERVRELEQADGEPMSSSKKLEDPRGDEMLESSFSPVRQGGEGSRDGAPGHHSGLNARSGTGVSLHWSSLSHA